jgi:DNA-binding NarL/FixJ family response regulator
MDIKPVATEVGVGQDSQMKRIKTIICDQHKNFREACKRILRLESDVEILAECRTKAELIPLVKTCKADLLLLDERVLYIEGMDVLNEIRACCPGINILCMTVSPEAGWCKKILEHGIRGVFEKDRTGYLIPAAIRKVSAGQIWLSRGLLSRLVADLRRNNTCYEMKRINVGPVECLL